MAVGGALLTHGWLRNDPQRRLIGQLVFFAALTALLCYHGIVPFDPVPSDVSPLQQRDIGLATIVWLSNAVWTLVGFVRVFLVFDGQPREG